MFNFVHSLIVVFIKFRTPVTEKFNQQLRPPANFHIIAIFFCSKTKKKNWKLSRLLFGSF